MLNMSKNTFKIYACAVDYQYIYTFCPNPKCRQQLHIYRSNCDISDRKFKITNVKQRQMDRKY